MTLTSVVLTEKRGRVLKVTSSFYICMYSFFFVCICFNKNGDKALIVLHIIIHAMFGISFEFLFFYKAAISISIHIQEIG